MESLNFNTPVRDEEGNIKNLADFGGGGGGGSKHTYATEEHEVGTWLDGSKLYEKTIVIENTLIGGESIPHNTTMSFGWIDNAFLYSSNDSDQYRGATTTPIMVADGGTKTVALTIDNTNIKFVGSTETFSAQTYRTLYVTIRYVK